MSENERKLTLWAKVFLILTCAALIIGNGISMFVCYAAIDETDAYDTEAKDPLADLAFMGIILASAVGCIVSAGIGNVLAIFFAAFASKAARSCVNTPRLKPISVALLIVSILALIFAVPINFILSIFLST